eukprot:21052-Heterococcus_DN1.PRE.1
MISEVPTAAIVHITTTGTNGTAATACCYCLLLLLAAAVMCVWAASIHPQVVHRAENCCSARTPHFSVSDAGAQRLRMKSVI